MDNHVRNNKFGQPNVRNNKFGQPNVRNNKFGQPCENNKFGQPCEEQQIWTTNVARSFDTRIGYNLLTTELEIAVGHWGADQ